MSPEFRVLDLNGGPERVRALALPFKFTGDRVRVERGQVLFGMAKTLGAGSPDGWETDEDQFGAATLSLETLDVKCHRLPLEFPIRPVYERGDKRKFVLEIPEWRGGAVFSLRCPIHDDAGPRTDNYLFQFWRGCWTRVVPGDKGEGLVTVLLSHPDREGNSWNLGRGEFYVWLHGEGDLRFGSDEEGRGSEEELRLIDAVWNWNHRDPAQSLSARKTSQGTFLLDRRYLDKEDLEQAPAQFLLQGLESFVNRTDLRLHRSLLDIWLLEAVPIPRKKPKQLVLFVRCRTRTNPFSPVDSLVVVDL